MTALAQITAQDALGQTIIKLMDQYRPKTILEIGSSDGTGSTRVITSQLASDARLFCIEMERDRFETLKRRYQGYRNVYCFNVPSVNVKGLMDRENINMIRTYHPEFNSWAYMPMEEFLLWYDNTVASTTAMGVNGIEQIKSDFGIKRFDMVLIDGSPFTALGEIDLVYGSRIIVMDDVHDLKCYEAMIRLNGDQNYEQIEFNPSYRNGYAVYKWLK